MQADDDWKFFVDREENYTLREFFEIHSFNFPMLIIITEGHCGETEIETLPAFQVLRCHAYTRQKRIVATTKSKDTISIPITYPHHFRVIDAKGRPLGNPKPLGEIVMHNHFPLQVEFLVQEDVSFCLNGEEKKISDFSPLSLTQLYEVTYITAFGVNEISIDETPILVPLFLEDVLLSTIAGIKGKSNQEFTDLLETFDTALENISLDTSMMYEDIALYSKAATAASENVYEYLQPDDYIRLLNRPAASSCEATYEMLKHTDPRNQDGFFKNFRKKVHAKRSNFSLNLRKKAEKILPTRYRRVPENTLQIKRSNTLKAFPSGEDVYLKSPVRRHSQILPHTPSSVTKQDFQARQYGQTTTSGPNPTVVSVADLTIDELSEKLVELKLGHHARAFRNQQIDGCIAVDLSEDILRWEFNFTTFEVVKFIRFINTGHVAK